MDFEEMHNAYDRATDPFKHGRDYKAPSGYGDPSSYKKTFYDFIVVHNQDGTYSVARSRSENLTSYEVVAVCSAMFEAQTIRTMYSEREGIK